MEQSGKIEDVPAHGRRLELDDLQRPLPAQTILWLCDCRPEYLWGVLQAVKAQSSEVSHRPSSIAGFQHHSEKLQLHSSRGEPGQLGQPLTHTHGLSVAGITQMLILLIPGAELGFRV